MNQFADPRTEWRISDIERSVNQKAEKYEVSTLSSNVDRLEHSLREASSEIDGLRNELQATQDQLQMILNRLEALEVDDV